MSAPSFVSALTADQVRGFCSRYLTRARARVGIEGEIAEDTDVQNMVQEEFFGMPRRADAVAGR
ncbi:hypothetical protein [Luethyella okanaganae]|uniref:hypothetical protein n=1 Tax=Luethyella okanaganae TaxID=69372 RepID=UPI0036DB59BC